MGGKDDPSANTGWYVHKPAEGRKTRESKEMESKVY